MVGYTPYDLEKRIGYTFENSELLLRALTHSSFSNEQKINKRGDYERLEFLGDAVLELISSDYLYHQNPDMPEGELTKLRASLVCESALAYCARDLELGKFIRLGRGEEMTGGRNRSSIIADVMEALIGAIYLDGGIEPAKKHILAFILTDYEEKSLIFDSKSMLQEVVQGQLKGEVVYTLLEETGPDHNKSFVYSVSVNGETIGTGNGTTKKGAEAAAAYQGILVLKEKGYVFKKH